MKKNLTESLSNSDSDSYSNYKSGFVSDFN